MSSATGKYAALESSFRALSLDHAELRRGLEATPRAEASASRRDSSTGADSGQALRDELVAMFGR